MSSGSSSRPALPRGTTVLLRDLRDLIDRARGEVAKQVNSALVLLYWQVGRRVSKDLLHERRGKYGQEILHTLSLRLSAEYGRGWSLPNIVRMVQLAQQVPDAKIIATLSQQLGWSHFAAIVPLRDPLQRMFYAEMCRLERWSVRMLRQKIASMLFERTSLSRKPRSLIRRELEAVRDQDRLTPDLAFRDPYVLDFLGLKDRYLEKDLEDAIMRDLERFLLELGSDFCFVARQKRITVDGEDHSLDLLFFHRGLRRLVALDLKLGAFQAADKGQMELYLRWLERHEQRRGEDPPIGLILCAGSRQETVELLELDRSRIRVATYWTKVLPRQLLRRRLRAALLAAQERLACRQPALSGSARPIR
ncbi:MAG: DUF1016 family protein [Planctomycetia bacterium]|nr:DUF1016 family protein [Planctomycetia bacterium]